MESCEKLVLDFDSETKQELVTVHQDLVKHLKPHQVRKQIYNKLLYSYLVIDFK